VTIDASRALGSGEVVAGEYRIEELLGEGGFGNVYRSTQLKLDRQVALKVLHPELLLSDRGLDRFIREARLAQSLEHPNTVRLFDFGQTDQGLPYIAWELLRGRPLDQVLDEDGPMAPARVTRVVAQILKSLMEAHDKGIVHRDVKPQNVFLSDFQGEPDFVKVLDFGVAKPKEAAGGPRATPVTMEGEIVGTPSYMPPEQVRGEGVGPAVDLYALGLVMAELLSGEMVYRAGSNFEICAEQLSEEPPPIPEEVLASPLGPVISRSTAKNASERYPSAEAMLGALQSLQHESANDPAWHRASRPPPRPGSSGIAFDPTQVTPQSQLPTSTGAGADQARSRDPFQRAGSSASANQRPSGGGDVSVSRPAAPPPAKKSASGGLAGFLIAAGAVLIAIVVAIVATTMTCQSCLGPSDSTPSPASWSPFPPPASAAELNMSLRPVDIVTGGGHACAIVEGGSLFCWGGNTSGQLGNGTATHAPRPVRVAGVATVVSVAVGTAHTCALRQDGSVLCWGSGADGRLGNGGAGGSRTPAAVAGLGAARALAAGDRHTCALLAGGAVSCWGSNFESQIGQPSGLSASSPSPVVGLSGIEEIAAGRAHTCARRSDGMVLCWGAGSAGQLGDGATSSRREPAIVGGLTGVTAIALGRNHSCALRGDDEGTVLCWGEGDSGQLGRPGDSFVAAVFPLTLPATAVVAGGDATCTLLQGGTVRCAGDNAQGRLGFGTIPTVPGPTQVPALSRVHRLGSGGSYVCAITDAPGAACWGVMAQTARAGLPVVYATAPTAVAFVPR